MQQDKEAKRLISKDNYITKRMVKTMFLALSVNAELNLYMITTEATLQAI